MPSHSLSPIALRPPGRPEDGSTLPATMMVVAVILAFLSAAALLTSQDGRFAVRQQGNTDALTAADAALEYAYGQWKTSVAATIHGNKAAVPPASTWAPDTLLTKFNASYANTGAFAANTGIVIPSGKLFIRSTDRNGQPLMSGNTDVSASAAPVYADTSNVPGYPGWSGKTYNYVASVTVTNPNHAGRSGSDSAITVNRYFQVTTVPLFQAAIFYENDLEIHPGAKMVVTGLVHSNASVYALGFLANVQFMNNVSYVGTYQESSNPSVRYGWDGSNSSASATPEIYNAYYGGFPDYWADGKPSSTSTTRASQINQVSYIDPFGGASQNNNGLHDIVEVPPSTNTSDQIAYNNASLRIIIDSSQTTDAARYQIFDGSNNALTGVDRTNVLAALKATAPTTFTDLREAATVTATSVDMAKLAYATVPTTTLNTGAEFGAQTFPTGTNSDGTAYGTTAGGTTFQKNFSGTVYIHDVGATTSSTRKAISLVNGRKLGQDVSIATDNGLYIQGDYNTGGNQASDVPTNGTGTNPQVTGYNRHSSAVMADAVTVLSNSWSDNNSGSSLSSRTATATTINTAILAGDVPSNAGGDGIASGGAHNFPRSLENWGPPSNSSTYVNFTYTGSLVEAFRSEKFTGSWQTNNVYKWPNRLWSFDTNFLMKQPPGVPTGIQFSRGRYERAIN